MAGLRKSSGPETMWEQLGFLLQIWKELPVRKFCFVFPELPFVLSNEQDDIWKAKQFSFFLNNIISSRTFSLMLFLLKVIT